MDPLILSAALQAAERVPVLLVHGIDDTGQKMAAIDRHLGKLGWPHRLRIDLVPSDGRASLAVLSGQVAEGAEDLRRQAGAERIDLVAFSMGTLVCRHFLQRRGGAASVRRFVSISGPHAGTLTGFLRWNQGASEMRPGSPFLKDLERDADELGRRVRCYSFFTPLDLMIVPSSSSQVTWARNETFPVLVHPWMVEDERVLGAVARVLGSP